MVNLSWIVLVKGDLFGATDAFMKSVELLHERSNQAAAADDRPNSASFQVESPKDLHEWLFIDSITIT